MISYKHSRSRQYSTETITNVDYADDLALLLDTPSQTKYLLLSQKSVARVIAVYVDSEKQSSCAFTKMMPSPH